MKRMLPSLLGVLALSLCLTGCGEEVIPVTATGTASAPEESYTAEPIDAHSTPELREQAYTNVPGTPTQNAVLDFTITAFPDTDEERTHPVTVLQPDERIVASLTDIYTFVREQEQMPVRYFPEDVQQQVQDILGGSSREVVDILHMSEFFGILPEAVTGEPLEGSVMLDADYTPGQLVVVLFGDTTAMESSEDLTAIHWTALAAQVETTGTVTFSLPRELFDEIAEEEALFLVLTVRQGVGGLSDGGETGGSISEFIPSKSVRDLTVEAGSFTTADGNALPEDFRIFLRSHTAASAQEIIRLQAFLAQESLPIAAYFSQTLQNQMSLLLENTSPDDLICYNANYLGAEHYVETYGDVIAGFRFATAYPEGSHLVCLLGTPKDPQPESQSQSPISPEETAFDWAVLRCESRDGFLWITFPQQQIPVMEQEGSLVLILSQPITGEESSET